jgi:hypothetical protein
MSRNPTKREMRDQDFADVMFYEMDNTAAALGIPPRWEREWTEEEVERIWEAGIIPRPSRRCQTSPSPRQR